MNFNDIYWHDAILKYVKINRNEKNSDTVTMEIEFETERIRLVFHDVYRVKMNLNFAVIVECETIYDAICEEYGNVMVQDVYKELCIEERGIFPLNYYEIITNSTGSRYGIVAKGFDFEKLSL
ncbi:MAG: hypothetical protein MJZ33_02930 [Paludibacteraceae bacterium]|nr:hypothetical protein [Paludibacteraceae bacterium]